MRLDKIEQLFGIVYFLIAAVCFFGVYRLSRIRIDGFTMERIARLKAYQSMCLILGVVFTLMAFVFVLSGLETRIKYLTQQLVIARAQISSQ